MSFLSVIAVNFANNHIQLDLIRKSRFQFFAKKFALRFVLVASWPINHSTQTMDEIKNRTEPVPWRFANDQSDVLQRWHKTERRNTRRNDSTWTGKIELWIFSTKCRYIYIYMRMKALANQRKSKIVRRMWLKSLHIHPSSGVDVYSFRCVNRARANVCETHEYTAVNNCHYSKKK